MSAVAGIAGVIPFVCFSVDVGKYLFFENAWDESFYELVINGKIANWNSYPWRVLAELPSWMVGGSGLPSAMLSDVMWPALVVLSAGYLALVVTRGWLSLMLVIFLLVFGSDILAFNSSAIYPVYLTVTSVLKLLTLDARRYFSDPFVSFLYLYRTPEPQLSLPVYFLHLAIMVEFIRRPAHRLLHWVVLAIVGFAAVNSYTFFAAASLATGGIGALSLIFIRRLKVAAGVFILTLLLSFHLVWQVVGSHSGEASATVFASSLPMITPSLIYALVLFPLFAFALRDKITVDAEVSFGLALYLVPFATMNQQVITGVMFQTLNWERYVNYPCLVLATVLLVNATEWTRVQSLLNTWMQSAVRRAGIREGLLALYARPLVVITLLALFSLFLYRTQLSNYRQYVRYNLLGVAYAMIIDQVYAEQADAPRYVTLDNSSYDAQVRVRLNTPNLIFNGYVDLVAALKEGKAKADSDVLPLSTKRNWGFEHAARLGLSRDQYEAKLRSEVDSQSCWPHLMYQFTFLECAPYVSDFRTYFPEKLKREIPAIGDLYQQFLRTGHQNLGKRGALVVSTSELSEPQPGAVWKQELAGTLQLATDGGYFAKDLSVRVYAYWQKPNS
jgi:hypothetical protein